MQVLEKKENELEIPEKIKEEQVRTYIQKRKSKISKVVNFFDIDGTIMKNIFPSLKKGKAANEDKNTIEELRNKLNKLSLFPEFVEYYRASKDKSLYNFFITGRKANLFSDITKKQLEPLQAIKPYTLPCYYPDNKKLTHEKYYQFKITAISHIVIELLKKHSIDVEIRIFDDDNFLFEEIYHQILSEMEKNEIEKNLSYMTHQIIVEEDWKTINQGFYSFSMYINNLEEIR